MEKLTINSQELIPSSGSGEDILTSSAPKKLVFSLQRFATSRTYSLSQNGTTNKITGTEKISTDIADYTLGRSGTRGVDGSGSPVAFNADFMAAYLYDTSNQTVSANTTYGLSSQYTISANNVRLAFTGDYSQQFIPGTVIDSSKAPGYWVGIGINTAQIGTTYNFGTSLGNDNVATYAANSKTYSAHYFNLGSSSYYGKNLTNVVTPVSNKSDVTYSVDFYDVKVGGTYAVNDLASTKEIDTKANSVAFKFDGLASGETESYTINGIKFDITGNDKDNQGTAIANLLVGSRRYETAASYAPNFTFSNIGSREVSANFGIAGGKTFTLNSIKYANQSTAAGSVGLKYSAGFTAVDAITFNGGAFNVASAENNVVYNLENNAVGSFTVKADTTFVLDIDGAASSNYQPMSFTTTAESMVIAKNGSNDITLSGGTFSMVPGTSLYNLGFILSDASIADINGYRFTDKSTDQSNTYVKFTAGTAVELGGLNINVSTADASHKFDNIQFTLQDSSSALLGSFGFSDTDKDGGTSIIKFGTNSETITLSSSSMSATGKFENTTFTLAKIGTYNINGTAYAASADGTAFGSNGLSFFAGTLQKSTDQVFTPGAGLDVSGTTVGTRITTAGDIEITAEGAYLYNGFYFGAKGVTSTDSATIKFDATDKTKVTLGGGLALELNQVGGTSTDSRTLVGLSGVSFTTTNVGGTFYLKDGGANIGINGLTFNDFQNNSGSKVTASYTSGSDLGIFGAVNLAASDALKNVQFTLNETSTAKFGSFIFSDTAGGNASIVKFGADNTNTVILKSSNMSATGLTGASIYLSDTGTYTIDGKGYSKTGSEAGSNTANLISFLNNQAITNSTTQIFDVTTKTVSGIRLGSNISALAGGGNTTETFETNAAKVLNSKYYFGNVGSAGAMVVESSSGLFTLTDKFEVSEFSTAKGSETVLVGLSGASFTAKTGGTFFLADDGKDVVINGLTFADTKNGTGTKLVASYGTSSAMSIFGAVTLTGSDTGMVFTLGSATSKLGSITMSNITFEGTQTSVQNTAKGAYSLGASNSAVFGINGTVSEASSFTMLSGAQGVFNFGGIGVVATSSKLTSAVIAGIAAGGELKSETSLASIGIGNGTVAINDKGSNDPFKIALDANGSVTSIFEINNGAVISNVASATSLVTEDSGIFTFKDANDKEQQFQIVGDANGVTFVINSSTGLVTSITGISNTGNTNVMVYITDTNLSGTQHFAKSSAQINGTEWEFKDGSWATDKYMGYVINGSGTSIAYTVYGIESDAKLAHTVIDTSKVGTAGATFVLSDTIFSQASQVSFLNQNNSSGFAASDSKNGLLFSSLGVNTDTGILYGSGTNVLAIAKITAEKSGSATAITSLSQIGSSSVSLALGAIPFNVLGTDYVVSGTSVGVAVNSSTVKVSANGKSAYVAMPGSAGISFGSSGTYVINGTTTNTLTIDATAANASALGTNKSVFTLKLAGGASVTDTFKAASDKLNVNGIEYGATGTATFSLISAASGSDTLNISAGMLTATGASVDTFSATKLAFSAQNAGLAVDQFSYTSLANTVEWSIGKESGTQLAKVTTGSIKEDVASGTAFFFNSDFYTATSKTASFNLDSTSGTWLAGSTAIGYTSNTGTYLVPSLNDSYTMTKGATIELSYKSGEKYDAFKQYTSGTGMMTATKTSGAFSLSDKWLTGGTDTQLYKYTAGSASDVVLSLSLTASDTGRIAFVQGLGTRSDTTATSFVYGANNATYTKVGDAALTYFVSKDSSTKAAGFIYNGLGSKTFNKDQDSASFTLASFRSDTYTFTEGSMNIKVESGTGTFSAGAGSATYIAEIGKGFHFAIGSGNAELYTATAITTLNASVSATGVISGLYGASGSGTRLSKAGDDTKYTIASLKNDSYTMAAGSTLLLQINSKDSGTLTYTAGTGTKAISAVGNVFNINDYYLNGTGSESATPYAYTASATGTLTLTFDSKTAKLDLGKVVGTRSDSTTSIFTYDFNSDKTLETYTKLSASDNLTYILNEKSSSTAAGALYSGVGTHAFDSNTYQLDNTGFNNAFNSDTGYVFTSGTVKLTLTEGTPAVSAYGGSATYTAKASEGKFHFAIGNGTAYEYTATTDTILYGIVGTDSKISGLYNASGAGMRNAATGETGTYVIGALNSDTYQMAANGAVMQLDITSKDSGTLKYIAGNGTLTVGSGTNNFSVSDYYLKGSGTTAAVLYTASGTGTLNLTLSYKDGTTTGLIDLNNVTGTRSDSAKAFTFDNQVYTTTSTAGLTYKIDKDIAGNEKYGAAGQLYAGQGTRGLGASDTNFTLSFLTDTYKADAGSILQLNINNAQSTTSLIAGSATYKALAGNKDEFHFVLNGATNTYTALADTILQVGIGANGSATGLIYASGTGLRDMGTTPITRSLSEFASDTYTFSNGTLQIKIPTKDSAVESVYEATGSLTASNTDFHVAFLAGGAYDSTTTLYTYKASGTAQVEVAFATGAVQSQTFKSGTAYRSGIASGAGSDTSFIFNTRTYSIVDAASATFKLDSDIAKTEGAKGQFYAGTGSRGADANDSYTSVFGNDYTNLVGSATYRITLANGTGTEAIYSASTTKLVGTGNSFKFSGTEYKAVSDVTLGLTMTAGSTTAVEKGLAGIGEFNSKDSSTTFAYAGNTYNVDSSTGAVLQLDFGSASQDPKFVRGAGTRELKSGDNYILSKDSNTYVMDSAGMAFVKVSDTIIQNLNSGSGTATFASGSAFNFALDGTNTKQYKATTEGAKLQVVGKTLENGGATVNFASGAGTRQDSTTGVAFTFNGFNYTSTETALTWTLHNNASGTAVEDATAGKGYRELSGDTFTYTSPTDKNNYTYKAEKVRLDLTINGENGTETLTQGTATRNIATGTTFAYAVKAFGTTDTLTATSAGTYSLEFKGNNQGVNSLDLALSFDTSTVKEILVDANASETKTTDFAYKAIVTGQTETYKPAAGGVNFNLKIASGSETVTWASGSATMTLAANRTFSYTADNASASQTYTVGTGSANFLRASQDKETFTGGDAFRFSTASDTFNISYLSDTYKADANGKIVLNVSGTAVTDVFNSGTATFNADKEFHFALGGATNTYTAQGNVMLQVGVANAAATGIVAASGTGIRSLNASETFTKELIGDKYTMTSGTYTLNLSAMSETFTGGTGAFTAATGTAFHLSNQYLKQGGDSAVYTYTAVEAATLNLKMDGASNTVTFVSGAGTRSDATSTFVSSLAGSTQTYTRIGDALTYMVNSTTAKEAAGYLYAGKGERKTVAGETATTVFNLDTYSVDAGATMQLTITSGTGVEAMTQGSATYAAAVGKVFHFGNTAYTAYSNTATLGITFSGDSSTNKLASISGQGTRAATASDSAMSLTYHEDKYNAVAGSSTVLFTAKSVSDTSEKLFETAGVVQYDVKASNTFHTNATADSSKWYAYQANKGFAISLNLSDSVQSFSGNVDAYRTATDTTFSFSNHTYTSTGTAETYSLTGSGTGIGVSALTDKLYTAAGTRTDANGDSYTSTLGNLYTLSSGTYAINVANGVGSDTLTAGNGTAKFDANSGKFHYGDSNTTYTANLNGATLGLTVNGTGSTETLLTGAGFDGKDKYLIASGDFTVGAGNATLNAPSANSSTLVTVTAGNALTGMSASLTGAFSSGNTLKLDDKLYKAEDTAKLDIFAINNVKATAGKFTAQGDFTSGTTTINSGNVKVEGDNDITVSFDASAINAINNLTGGVEVKNAAGAAKAYSDSTGTFKFDSTVTGGIAPASGTQLFNITNDSSVTFQLDSATGLVTGIAGIDAGSVFTISDTTAETITVSSAGKVLQRGADGKWTDAEVIAASYLVSVTSDDKFAVYAVDNTNSLTKVENNRIGATSDTGAVTINFSNAVDTDAVVKTPVYVVNQSSDMFVNTTYLNGIGLTASNMAVQISSATNTFNAGTYSSDYQFAAQKGYSIENGKFSVGDASAVTVGLGANTSAAAIVKAQNDASVNFLATSDTAVSNFSLNDSAQVGLSIAAQDKDGKGLFAAVQSGGKLSGLNPNGVDTGAAVVNTTTDATTFSIGNASVVVTNDNDADGMTLGILNDTLNALNNISTDASIQVTGLSAIAIDGTDTVAVGSDPITYNATNKKWISGEAAAADATGYLMLVNAQNKVELFYTTDTGAVVSSMTKTTNKADYLKAFEGMAPDKDGGELPTYVDSLHINQSISSDVKVSVSAANGSVVVNSPAKDIALVTANGKYTINSVGVEPSSEVVVTALSSNSVSVPLSSTTTISNNTMKFSASNTATAIFSADIDSTVSLTDSAKVTNTNSAEKFVVSGGTVSFDNVELVTASVGSVNVSGVTFSATDANLSINNKAVSVAGDTSFKIDMTALIPTISGVSGNTTIQSDVINAVVKTESAGTFKFNAGDPFTIVGDNEVVFTAENGIVVGIDSLNGAASGNFGGNGVKVDGNSVVVLNDTLITANADGTVVTELNAVGNADTDVVVANAGGATIVNADASGSFYFGAPNSAISTQHFNVTDSDNNFAFLTKDTTDHTPIVTGITGVDNGQVALSQNATDLRINSDTYTITDIASGSEVSVVATNGTVTTVKGLRGSLSGVGDSVSVQIVDNDATINGTQISITEADGTDVVATGMGSESSNNKVISELNNNAVVKVAKSMLVKTNEEGAFTFVDDIFTISGDTSVTFETDENSRVKNIADFAGTLRSSALENTVNGSAVSVAKGPNGSITDTAIVSAGTGVSSVVGLADGDSVSVANGVSVAMPGTTSTNTDTAITVNGKPYHLEGDSDGLEIKPTTSGEVVNGLAANARLTVGAAGSYTVNDTLLTANAGDVIVGDPEGSAHVKQESDMDLDETSTTDEIIKKVTGYSSEESEERYVETWDSDTAESLLERAAENPSLLNGNIKMTFGNNDREDMAITKRDLNFSANTGIKNIVDHSDKPINLKFNNEGGNIAEVGDDSSGEKNLELGNGGDIAIVGSTSTPVNITAGQGRDDIVSKGRNVKLNLTGGRARVTPLGGKIILNGYEANTGSAIQSTLNNIFGAIKTNIIKLANDVVTMNNGAIVDFSGGASSADEASNRGYRVVNFLNVKGLETKVLYTYDGDEKKDVNESAANEDMVVKGNYTDNGAQRKSGSAVIKTGKGNDSALVGSNDNVDLGAGNNTVMIESTRNLSAGGTTITQTATTGNTKVTGYHSGFSDNDDSLNFIDPASTNAQYVNGKLVFSYQNAVMEVDIAGSSSVSTATAADLAESADEDDSVTNITGTIDFASTKINGIKTAIASKGNFISITGGDSVWKAEYMPTAYVGENSGLDLRQFDGAVEMTLPGAANTATQNTSGKLDGTDVTFRGIEKLKLGDGNATVYGASNVNNTIVAGTGASSVWGGGASNDLFIARRTSLKSGASSVFFVNGDGNDTITNFQFLTTDTKNTSDVVNVLDSAVTGANVSGNDVIINLSNEADRLTVKEAVGKDFRLDYLENGVQKSLVAQVGNDALNFDGLATYYQANTKNAAISVNSSLNSAEIWLNNERTFSPTNTFVGDIKTLNASAVNGKSTLVGNGYDNVIIASSEGSSLWGSDKGGDDSLVGGAGADMFWYGKKNGNDTIAAAEGQDVINLYDLFVADVDVYSDWKIDANSISFNVKDSAGGGSLTIQSNNSGIGFRFADQPNTTYYINQSTKEYDVKK